MANRTASKKQRSARHDDENPEPRVAVADNGGHPRYSPETLAPAALLAANDDGHRATRRFRALSCRR